MPCRSLCYSWETDRVVFVLKFRAYIEFERPRIVDRGLESNSIVPAVYKAIKMRSGSISISGFFFHPSCIVKECNREKRRRHNHSAITELLIVYNFWLRAFEDTRQCSLNLYDTLTIINLCSCFALFAGSWGFLSIFTSLKQEMHKWTGWWSRGGLLEKL